MKTFTQEQINTWRSWLGTVVVKISGKPFKSTFKSATVTGFCDHPVTGRLCFTFQEDDTYVECCKCERSKTGHTGPSAC